LYLGPIEIYREYNNANSVILERESLHVMDDKKRIAMVDTPTVIPQGNKEIELIRYQYDNHLASATFELDDKAQIISYEEYFPYGGTSYSTIDATREVPAKRYRYTGKERDEESGLNYHGARYYALWLCRWTAADPAGTVDGTNLYSYVRNNPANFIDAQGKQSNPLPDYLNWDPGQVEPKEAPLSVDISTKKEPGPKDIDYNDPHLRLTTGAGGFNEGQTVGEQLNEKDVAEMHANLKNAVKKYARWAESMVTRGPQATAVTIVKEEIVEPVIEDIIGERTLKAVKVVIKVKQMSEAMKMSGDKHEPPPPDPSKKQKAAKPKLNPANTKNNPIHHEGTGAPIKDGSFSIVDWSGYPTGRPRPKGPFRIIEGLEYDASRFAADEMNAEIRLRNPDLRGEYMDIHEIQPVKFGGNPTDWSNKELLPRPEHWEVHKFWDTLQRYHTNFNF
jgi:RHS repeat-associated protein